MKCSRSMVLVILLLFAVVASAEDGFRQISIRADFLSVPVTVLDKLNRHTPDEIPSAKAILELKRAGKATSLGAPMLLTPSGQQSTLKSVTEVIYPTGLSLTQRSTTNVAGDVLATSLVAPDGFETREIGVSLEVLPEVSTDGDVINLTFDAEIVDPPTWKEYPAELRDSKGKAISMTMEMPFFHIQSFTTSAKIKNGATVIVGGGMKNPQGDAVTFLLLKAQLVTSKAEAAAHIAGASAKPWSLPERRFQSNKEWLHFQHGQLAAIAIFEDLEQVSIAEFIRPFGGELSYYPPRNKRINFDDDSWIILTANSIHEMNGLSDMTLGIASDGKYYLNLGHVCGGVILESEKEVTSLSEFLGATGLGPKRESMTWAEHQPDDENKGQQD
jgi:hypothetical protein